jgi:hypothetical protein
MRLDSSLKMEAVLAGAVAANQPDVHVDYSVWNNEGKQTKPAPFRTVLNSTTDVTILAAPGTVGFINDPEFISIYNKDTASVTVTVKTDDGTTERIIQKVTLLTLEALQYEKGRGWYALDANGNAKANMSANGVKEVLTTTVTGYASDPSISIRITKFDDVVNISIPTFTGTSDSTGKATATALPAAYRPPATTNIPIVAVDNGGTAAMGLAAVGTDGIITFYPTPASGNWTGSGTATVSRADGTYHL